MYTKSLTKIVSTLGDNKGGIVELLLWPIEWLLADIVPDVLTNKVTQLVILKPGKTMVQLKCQSETLMYEESPKESGSGDYYAIRIKGIVNLDDEEKNLQLETIRYMRLCCIYTDKNGRQKIIGNMRHGMKLAAELTVQEETSGKSFFEIILETEQEKRAAFYL